MQYETAELPIEGRYSLLGRVNTYDLGPLELYNALDHQLERQVAMQVLPATAPPEEQARFLETQRVVAGIHHCGVIQVYDVGDWHGSAFAVLEKDAAAPGGPSPAPDTETALSRGRQVAEALQCVRDAGLETWVFTPAALRAGADGAPRLALLEGLEHDGRYRSAVSGRRDDDGRALGALLEMYIAGLPLAAVPSGVHALIERATKGSAGAPLTGADFAAEVSRLELAAQQLTEQYAQTPSAAAAPYGAAGLPDPHDAPTLAAPVVPSVPVSPSAPYQPVAPPDRPYSGPPPESAARLIPPAEGAARGVPLVPLAAAGLLLLALLLFIAWPRGSGAPQVAGSAASAADLTPTRAPAAAAAPTAVLVAAPEFLGKTLPEAKSLASAAGLGLLVAAAAPDSNYPVDTVAAQDPAPGTPLPPGSDVSLVMSLGPEQPTAQQAEPAPPSGEDDGNKNGKDNGRGKKKP